MKTRTLSQLAAAAVITALSTGALANQWFGDDPYWKSQAAVIGKTTAAKKAPIVSRVPAAPSDKYHQQDAHTN